MANGGDEPFLPPEIIINILKRLPVKSLVRFQCGCKEWKNLFKTPSFIAEHLHHSDHKNPFLLLHEYYCRSIRLLNQNLETVEILSIPFRHGWKIIGSCNGLLCVITNLYLSLSPRLLCLWNPATRKVREIPQTTNDYWGICVFGFGFSSIVNDYKIVKFYNQELRKKKKEDHYFIVANYGYDLVEVYSLSTGLWKELEFGALQNIRFRTTAVSADGTMVWLGKEDLNPVLVSFDIVTEVFTITPIDGVSPTNLGVWEDKFAIFWYGEYNATDDEYDNAEDGFNSTDVRLRLLEQVASESGKSLRCADEYSIDTFSRALHPLCIWRNEVVFNDIGIGSEAEPESEYLDLFNLGTKKWEGLSNRFSAYDRLAGFNYEMSLVSVSVCNTQV
ncbi:hypothetical protein K1719_004961 [Acacia pycnantha]|nr:hypothetical protein K1719_004961 [Acacia pycnantha]